MEDKEYEYREITYEKVKEVIEKLLKNDFNNHFKKRDLFDDGLFVGNNEDILKRIGEINNETQYQKELEEMSRHEAKQWLKNKEDMSADKEPINLTEGHSEIEIEKQKIADEELRKELSSIKKHRYKPTNITTPKKKRKK